MHAKHLYIPHLARPLSAKAYGVSQCLVFAREDCSDGLLRRIAQKDCLVGLSGCSSWGLNWFLKWGSHMPRTRVSGWEQGLVCTGNTSTWLGSQKSGGVGARVGGLRARLVWERAARGAFAACAVERRARTWVSGWDQGFGCWEFVDMAWVIKKWRRGRACRGAARAASVGRCRSRCVGCMCGRAACAVCRRPAWRRGRRARAAHKYRLPAGGAFSSRIITLLHYHKIHTLHPQKVIRVPDIVRYIDRKAQPHGHQAAAHLDDNLLAGR